MSLPSPLAGRCQFSPQTIGIKGKSVKNGGQDKKSEKTPPYRDVARETFVSGREYFY
jgi:hypothetical protein